MTSNPVQNSSHVENKSQVLLWFHFGSLFLILIQSNEQNTLMCMIKNKLMFVNVNNTWQHITHMLNDM